MNVEAVLDNNGRTLFEIGDIITCDFKSMKVTGIDEQNNILTVERGFVRAANPHQEGIRIAA